MQIKNMFHDDINRPINGVIKVDQDADDVIFDEVKEYVITKELRKHFQLFSIIIVIPLMFRLADIGVVGFLDSLEVVNLTS